MSSRTIRETAARLLESLPPYEADDETVQAAGVAIGNELERLDIAANDLRDRLFPSQADDSYNTLSIYEGMLGLPVKPVGLTVEERVGLVMSNIKRRHSSAGSDWVATINEAIGTGWTHTEFGPPYTVTLTLPTGWPLGAVKSLVRRITPAHLHVVIGYGGFIIGHGIHDPTASPVGEGLV